MKLCKTLIGTIVLVGCVLSISSAIALAEPETTSLESTQQDDTSEEMISETNKIAKLDDNTILGSWTGYYKGAINSVDYERKLDLKITSCQAGELSGTAIIDDGRSGSYLFSGNIDQQGQYLVFTQKEWISNPSDLADCTFDGYFDSDTQEIKGGLREFKQFSFELKRICIE